MSAVQYKADIFSASGYARASRANIRALVDAGVDVKCKPVRHDNISVSYDPWWESHAEALLNNPTESNIRITQQTPDLFRPNPGLKEIGYTVCETDKLPTRILNNNPYTNWVSQLNSLSRVWTASEFCKGVMENSGVTVPIDVFPHPIDLEEMCPTERQPLIMSKDESINDNKMVFLAVFQWNQRKDPLRLLLTWWALFGDNPEVQLVLKTYSADFNDNRHLIEAINKFKKDCWLPSYCNNVHVITGQLAEGKMKDLYNSVDVLISTTRGEGFGLPMQEAMACGVPVIYPNATALREFCVGYPVETFKEPAHSVGVPNTNQTSPWFSVDMNWWTVNPESLRAQMQQAYADWLTARRMPEHMAVDCRAALANHTYEVVGQRMRETIESIS